VNKNISCCFSGHREAHFDMDFSQAGYAFQGALQKAIRNTIDDGYRIFYNGLAQGFDIIAAEAIIKEKYARDDCKLILVSVAPFKGQELKWGKLWRTRHDEVLKASDEIVTLNERYIKGCYYERNRYLIDHTSRLICFYSGKNSGTKHTFDYAEEKGLDIVNLWQL